MFKKSMVDLAVDASAEVGFVGTLLLLLVLMARVVLARITQCKRRNKTNVRYRGCREIFNTVSMLTGAVFILVFRPV